MRIAVDTMGGDRGPQEVVRGVIDAAQNSANAQFLLVGDRSILEAERAKSRSFPQNIEVVNATQIIQMCDEPVAAFKKKPDASVVVAARMVKERRADAVVTIGNTGAAMAVSLLTWGRIKGIDRPAIATPLPSLTGTVVLLDAGATPDCDPNNLYEFAIMGSVYANCMFGVADPRVGIVSNGEEESKGNQLVKRTHALFKQVISESAPFTFIGNIEGKDIFRGGADVVVCDGFVGNVVLKTGEGVAEMVLSLIKEELGKHAWMKPFVLPMMPALRRLKRRIDYAERGGAPLLGVNGICIIGHGRSDAFAVTNACRAAMRAVQADITETIRKRICEMPTPPPE
jgi:glycerol-3-phosphate acyltransferase PlsX